MKSPLAKLAISATFGLALALIPITAFAQYEQQPPPQGQYYYPPPPQQQPPPQEGQYYYPPPPPQGQYYYPPPPQQPPPPPQQPPPPPSPPKQQSKNLEQRTKVQRLINNGIAENKEEIQKEALSLSHLDRAALYKKNKKGFIGYSLLNTVPGFGLGSYAQGDVSSGIILSLADIAVGSLCLMDQVMYGTFDKDGGDAHLILPISIAVAGRIAGWIFTSGYKNKYNKVLDEALNPNNNVSYSIDPLIVPANGTPAIGLAFNVRY